jgi:type III secretion protein S
MNEILSITRDALALVLWLSLPPLLVAALTGILVGLVQSVTQLQDQAISYGIKVITVSLTVFFTGAWMHDELMRMISRIFAMISVPPGLP